MNINRAIKSIMAEKGVRSMDLAERSGMHSSNISTAIGPKCNPRMSTLELFAECLEVKVSDIILKAESIKGDK